MSGKEKCEFLKGIRKRMAEANGIPFEPRECDYNGECSGTCPFCEKEADDLLVLLKEKMEQGTEILTDKETVELLKTNTRRLKEERQRLADTETGVVRGDYYYEEEIRKRQREEMERLIEEQNRPLMGDIRRDFTPLYNQEEEIRMIRELDEKEERLRAEGDDEYTIRKALQRHEELAQLRFKENQ